MMASSSSNSIEAKIVILGGQGVGKTSLVHRFVDHSFVPNSSTTSTVGASFLTKRVTDIDSSTVVRLQIWDTAGQERFRSISKLYYRGANAALLCYDITSPTSFTEMSHWLHELKANLAPDTILHIVGTKADLVAEDPSRRKIPFESCVAYAAEHLYPPSTTNTSITNTPTPTPIYAPGQAQRQSMSAAGLQPRNEQMVGSPQSNRSSMGFWGLDIGWDSCHEVSASTGEGVEEVFRVITRRLVEQRAARAALEARLAEDFGLSSPDGERGDYVYGQGGAEGSFRVGMGDKRRSWLGIPQFPVGGSVSGGDTDAADGNVRRKRGPCCT